MTLEILTSEELAPEQLVTLNQIHSDTVLSLSASPAPAAEGKPHADGMITATPGIGLGILTADCQPVLFADTEAGVIGAAHAGWRGALGGVLEQVIDKMVALGPSARASPP